MNPSQFGTNFGGNAMMMNQFGGIPQQQPQFMNQFQTNSMGGGAGMMTNQT